MHLFFVLLFNLLSEVLESVDALSARARRHDSLLFCRDYPIALRLSGNDILKKKSSNDSIKRTFVG